MKLIGVVLVAVLGFIWYSYNKLVSLSQLKKEAWSGIDVQLKRRADLIPNLVEVVKSYKDFEQETLSEVTKLRAQCAEATDLKTRANLEQGIGSQLRQILATAEAYPELKASTQFANLHEQLVAVEDDLQYARRYFNGTVRDLNTSVEMFPANLFANSFGFKADNYFELEYATERKTPDVSFT